MLKIFSLVLYARKISSLESSMPVQSPLLLAAKGIEINPDAAPGDSFANLIHDQMSIAAGTSHPPAAPSWAAS